MKRATFTDNILLVNPEFNLLHSERQNQRTFENNRVLEKLPGLKIKSAPLANAPPENTGDREKTKLCIKNMVSIRCKIVVKAVLEDLGLNYSTVELGEVEIIGNLSDTKRKLLKFKLSKYGFELMENKSLILVEKIKLVIIEMIHYQDEMPHINFSNYLSDKLNHSYTYLANLFSEVKGMPIQHFMILRKIERVKELLVYDELPLKEIAYRLNYSSIAHLSNQFKKITGLTPTHFKNMKHKRLRAIDSI